MKQIITAKAKKLTEIHELPLACDRAWQDKDGILYTGRKYGWWQNMEKKMTAIYVRKTGERIVLIDGHNWEKAVNQLIAHLAR